MKIYPYVNTTRANKDGSFPVYFIISTKQGRFFVNTGITTCDKLVEMSFPKADANWKRKTILLGKYFASVTSLCLERDIAGMSNEELKYIEEYKINEISEITGVNASAVKMRLSRGRKLLEEKYRKEYM